MIAITPAIVGPAIEEEYADALAAIKDIKLSLGQCRLTNDTPDGRVLLNVMWLEQEIADRRLPIPVHESFVRTILYLVGSGELDAIPGFQEALGRLWLVLKGYGLMKDRHLPVLIAMIDDFLHESNQCKGLDDNARRLLEDVRAQGEDLKNGGSWPKRRVPQDRFTSQIDRTLEKCVPDCANRLRGIDASLFEAWRPRPARKPPLPAPVPGLLSQAPFG